MAVFRGMLIVGSRRPAGFFHALLIVAVVGGWVEVGDIVVGLEGVVARLPGLQCRHPVDEVLSRGLQGLDARPHRSGSPGTGLHVGRLRRLRLLAGGALPRASQGLLPPSCRRRRRPRRPQRPPVRTHTLPAVRRLLLLPFPLPSFLLSL